MARTRCSKRARGGSSQSQYRRSYARRNVHTGERQPREDEHTGDSLRPRAPRAYFDRSIYSPACVCMHWGREQQHQTRRWRCCINAVHAEMSTRAASDRAGRKRTPVGGPETTQARATRARAPLNGDHPVYATVVRYAKVENRSHLELVRPGAALYLEYDAASLLL